MLSTEQRCKIAAWQEASRSPVEVQRRFRAAYGINYVSSRPTIFAIHAKFLQTGSVNDQPPSGRPRTGHTEENVEAVEAAFVQSQRKSIHRASLELNINRASIQQMLRKWLWFSDEMLFHLSGSVNRHNVRFWGTENPVEVREHQRDSPKLVVWCAMTSVGLVGPYFFKEENGDTANVNGVNYLHMLQNFFVS